MDVTSEQGSGPWLRSVFVVVSLTLAAGYYVPLYRTHRTLVADYATLAARTTEIERDLTKARAALGAITMKSEELARARLPDRTGRRERAGLEEQLSAKLASRIGKGELVIGLRSDGVRITVPAALKQAQMRWVVTGPAEGVLCDIAAALAGTPSTIVVVAEVLETKASPGAFSAREVGGLRAASVARTLEQQCAYPSERLATLTRTAEDGAASGAENIVLRIESSER